MGLGAAPFPRTSAEQRCNFIGIADQCTGQWFSRQNHVPIFNNVLGDEKNGRKEDEKKRMLTMVVMVKVDN